MKSNDPKQFWWKLSLKNRNSKYTFTKSELYQHFKSLSEIENHQQFPADLLAGMSNKFEEILDGPIDSGELREAIKMLK